MTTKSWCAGVVCSLGLCIAGPVLAAGDREHVTMEQLPALVSKTILKEAKGSPLLELEKSTEGDKVTYEAEFRAKNGRKVEIEVDASGKLVSKKVEMPLGRRADPPPIRSAEASDAKKAETAASAPKTTAK